MGFFDGIISLQGTPSQVSQVQQMSVDPGVAGIASTAINTISSLLPPSSEARKWLTTNPSQILNNIKTAIFGRKYTTGDYRLAERYNDQILCAKDISQPQATDDMVAMAHVIFNLLFGVRISVEDDLNALEQGFDAYKARAVSQGMSDSAIKRAVFLKQTYYPNSTYNVSCWDLSWFARYPLVQPIPDYNLNRNYTGKLPGGGFAQDGVIPVDAGAVIKQVLGAQFDEQAGYASALSAANLKKYAPFIAIGSVLLVAIILFYLKKRKE